MKAQRGRRGRARQVQSQAHGLQMRLKYSQSDLEQTKTQPPLLNMQVEDEANSFCEELDLEFGTQKTPSGYPVRLRGKEPAEGGPGESYDVGADRQEDGLKSRKATQRRRAQTHEIIDETMAQLQDLKNQHLTKRKSEVNDKNHEMERSIKTGWRQQDALSEEDQGRDKHTTAASEQATEHPQRISAPNIKKAMEA
ncbi:structural maintenance of chromosomes protein 1A isoform X1 [Lates japonicus]|uniref:Structural maintenance of chromosomes protein 1A isoform X1 n=1 Tax=Lates japonicus TaxID=270547 RepID=A0AAD3RLY7_LATJO|nr:structural maintenance of chromosomes protein 1A isoform X1 [Lates japonicus]